MDADQKKIVKILIKEGNNFLSKPQKLIDFTGDKAADRLLNNLRCYPHAYVLACIMDRQINTERAWMIPIRISQIIGGFDFFRLRNLNLDYLTRIFEQNSLHRFNKQMAINFYQAIQKIAKDYKGNAALIWKGAPSSAAIVRRFLEFRGVGIKIATMATNILAREFKIPMGDYICIDISPDVHVKRVFKRIGFIGKEASNDELIYCARELNAEYPGIFDLSCWEIGKNWCRPKKPTCNECYLNKHCPKII